MVDVIAKKPRRGVINEMLYADDLFPMSKTIKEKTKENILELEGCTGSYGFEGQHQKNISDGKWVGRRTIQK